MSQPKCQVPLCRELSENDDFNTNKHKYLNLEMIFRCGGNSSQSFSQSELVCKTCNDCTAEVFCHIMGEKK